MAVTINQTGEQFVNQINTDVAAAAQNGGGGSVSSVTHVHHLQMQGGQIGSDGYTKGAIARNSPNEFKRYAHTIMMMNIENFTISSVTTNDTLTIFYYGADMAYLGNVSSVSSIPSTACYVKFQTYNSSGYSYLPELAVTVSGVATLHKNTTPEQLTSPKTYSGKLLTYETFMPKPNGVSSTTYNGNNYTRYYDNGYIVLPPNYSVDGDPVPLIIWVHGTSAGDFTSTTTSYPAEREFVAKNGYAMCACSGMTNEGTYSSSNTLACPSFAVAVVNFAKFCLSNYNLKQDGVYIACKSSGGFVAHLLALTQPIKVRALGSHSPALSPIVSMANHANQLSATATMEAQQIGVDYTFSGTFVEADKNAVLNNIDKWRTIDPFFMGCDLTDDEIETIVEATWGNVTTGNVTGGLNIANGIGNETLLGGKRRYIPCPVKIWHGSSDANVPYANSRLYVEMAQRAGAQCFLRTISGAYHDANHTQMKGTYNTRYGGSVSDVPGMWVELIDWFNQW